MGRLPRWLRTTLMVALVLGAWELSFHLGLINPLIFGAPTLVAKAVLTDWQPFLRAFQVTAIEVAIASAFSWIVGLTLGVLLALSRLATLVTAPILSAIVAVPLVVLYPILVAWLGIGMESKIVFGIVLGIFPIMLSTMAGVQSVDQGFVTMARANGATWLQRAVRVIVPLALPAVLSGIRLGTALIIAGVVLTEMLAATDGLGFWISYHRSLFNTGQVYLGILLILAITAVVGWIVSLFERKYGRWRTEQQI